MTKDTALAELNRLFSEAWHRTDFTVYTGHGHEVTVAILDGGPENPNARYCAKATTEDGRQASGNACESVQTALQIVHWHEIGLTWSGGGDSSALQPIRDDDDED